MSEYYDFSRDELASLIRSCIRLEQNPFSKGWGDPDELVEVVDTIEMKKVWQIAGKILGITDE